MTDVLGLYNYWIVVVLMMTGFYVIMARANLVKKIIGLNLLQASVILLYVSLAKISGGTAAILVGGHGDEGGHGGGHGEPTELAAEAAGHALTAASHAADVIYSNPLPHVLMLTAIVVGVATTALGLALVVRIQEAYGTIEEDEIRDLDDAQEARIVAREGGAA